MNPIIMLKMICWFLAILFTMVNFLKTTEREEVPAVNFVLQAMGITGLIILYFEIGG